ncbi:MAG: hypothetical protein P9M03_11770 [Candidatus Theseobacter exili]|nr:hypothetical protein [Candidatus Theseobacter exili]
MSLRKKLVSFSILSFFKLLLAVTSIICILLLIYTIWQGQPGTIVILLGKPTCVLVGFMSWLGWFWIHTGLHKSRKEIALFFGKIILLLFSLLLALVLGELTIRKYLRVTQGFNSLGKLKAMELGEQIQLKSFTPLAAIVHLSKNKNLVYELIPSLKREFGGKHLKTNSAGMHDSLEYSLNKNPSTIRIIGIGDSDMFGWGVEQFENYLAVLEKNLADKQGKNTYEVLNFAVPGYNTQQEIELLKSKGLSYQPDIVILGWCENDFNAPFFVYRKKEYRQLKKSYLYSYLFYRKGTVIQPEIMKVSELDSEFINPEIIDYTGPEGVKKSLLKLKQLGKEYRFKIIVFGAMKPVIIAICKAVNLDYYNILEEIPYDTYPREYEVYYMHPRAEGHRVLAEHLEKKLKTKGWLKKKSSKQ